MAMVAIENLFNVYQLGLLELRVLRELDLRIEQGEYVAIMGPSGPGKSILLNMIGCLDHPTSGNYFLGDQKVSELEDDQLSLIRGACIGFVFQSFNLINQLNVIENIEVPMYYQGRSELQRTERAKELAEMVGLGERIEHQPSELSGGQLQRVAIARELAHDPQIILADEPTGNLDSESGTEILKILVDFHKQGKTLIIVTHDRDVSVTAERLVEPLNGRIARHYYNQEH